MENLIKYGWSSFFNEMKQLSQFKELDTGRISSVHKSRYEVFTENGIISAEIAGNLQFKLSLDELPCVGDWVNLQLFDDFGIIVEVLARKTILRRKKAGNTSEGQNIASNLDKGIVVQSLDQNFNIRRLERMIIQLKDSNIFPIIVLNKMDLCDNFERVKTQLEVLGNTIPIIYSCAQKNEGISDIEEHLKLGETIIFIGSSGVGKSTIVNALLENQVQEVKEVSGSNYKGKHTTTSRKTFLLKNGSIVIDTPGVREFGLAVDSTEAINDGFKNIDYFSKDCFFQDCSHTNEKGCAVVEAVNSGELDRDQYNSYLKLKKESEFYEMSKLQRRKKEKEFGKFTKAYQDKKKKNNFGKA